MTGNHGTIRAIAICAALVLAAAAPSVHAADGPARQPLKLAVVNLHDDQTIGDLLFLKLAQLEGVELVERDRLDALTREWKLSSLNRKVNMRLGKLVRADAILFVEPDDELLHIAFVDAGRGIRLLDSVYEAQPESYPQIAEATVSQLTGLSARLGTESGQRTYLAVAPVEWKVSRSVRLLRETVDTLLGVHLAQIPRAFVMERRHFETLVREADLAGESSPNVLAADRIVRTLVESDSAGQLTLTVQLRQLSSNAAQVRSFRSAPDDLLPVCREITTWVAGEIDAGSAARVEFDLTMEAAAHHRNGRVYAARAQHEEAARARETAWLLDRDNDTYAADYLKTLRSRMNDRKRSAAQQINDYLQVLHLARRLDPDRKSRIDVHSLVYHRHDELVAPARAAVRAYYEWYCGFDDQLQDVARRRQWAASCPVFFDSPEEALEHLRWVISLGEYDWADLVSHSFGRVSRWDSDRRRGVWLQFLDEIARCGEERAEFFAHKARCYYVGVFDYDNRRRTAERTQLIEDFYAWLTASEAHAKRIMWQWGEQSRLWLGFDYLSPESQRKYFDPWMLRVVKRDPGHGLHHVLPALDRLRKHFPDDDNVELQIDAWLEATLQLTKNSKSPKYYEGMLAAIQSKYPDLQALLRDGHVLEKSPGPNWNIDGWVSLYDYERDAKPKVADNAPSPDGFTFLLEDDVLWMSWTACNIWREEGKTPRFNAWHQVLVRADATTGRSDVFPIAVREAISSLHNGMIMRRWGDRLCVADLCGVSVVPRDERDQAVIDLAVSIKGMPRLGHIGNRPSALIPAGEYLYIGVRTTTWGKGIGNYGGLFRWKPGMDKADRVAAAHSLESGPLNDTFPYQILRGEFDEESGSLLLQIRTADDGPKSGWWRFAPDEKPESAWEWIGEREHPVVSGPSQWRVSRDSGAARYYLDFRTPDGDWQTVAEYKAVIKRMKLLETDHGLFWIIGGHDIHYLPRGNWPGAGS